MSDSAHEKIFAGLLFSVLGVYLIIRGATADHLADESEGLADKDRNDTKATPLRRLVVVAAGLAASIYGIVHALRY